MGEEAVTLGLGFRAPRRGAPLHAGPAVRCSRRDYKGLFWDPCTTVTQSGVRVIPELNLQRRGATCTAVLPDVVLCVPLIGRGKLGGKQRTNRRILMARVQQVLAQCYVFSWLRSRPFGPGLLRSWQLYPLQQRIR
jgi:hypothetical protein